MALRWRNVGSDSITVAERYCRGEWGDSKPLHDDHLAVVEHDAGRAAWEANCSLSPRCDPIEGLARIAKNTKVKSN